ncbi:MAG: hypothetical protein J5939_01120 [Bacteroidales bacterium]|nr:hypothetical protein [Bacteroidales bacterium]
MGTVSAHEDIPGNPCIWVDTGKGQVLVPLHEELVLSLDETSKTLRMQLPEGILDV